MKIWECKIGIESDVELPFGADMPMRAAVRRAFIQITGKEPDFTFSGWGATLNQIERDIIDQKDRTPGDMDR